MHYSPIYLIKYSTCFGHAHCPSSGASQHCIHAIGICDSSSADVCQNQNNKYLLRVYSVEILLMMDSGHARNMQSTIGRGKFRQKHNYNLAKNKCAGPTHTNSQQKPRRQTNHRQEQKLRGLGGDARIIYITTHQHRKIPPPNIGTYKIHTYSHSFPFNTT